MEQFIGWSIYTMEFQQIPTMYHRGLEQYLRSRYDQTQGLVPPDYRTEEGRCEAGLAIKEGLRSLVRGSRPKAGMVTRSRSRSRSPIRALPPAPERTPRLQPKP